MNTFENISTSNIISIMYGYYWKYDNKMRTIQKFGFTTEKF